MSAVLMTLFAVSILGALWMAVYGLRVLVGRWEQPPRYEPGAMPPAPHTVNAVQPLPPAAGPVWVAPAGVAPPPMMAPRGFGTPPPMMVPSGLPQYALEPIPPTPPGFATAPGFLPPGYATVPGVASPPLAAAPPMIDPALVAPLALPLPAPRPTPAPAPPPIAATPRSQTLRPVVDGVQVAATPRPSMVRPPTGRPPTGRPPTWIPPNRAPTPGQVSGTLSELPHRMARGSIPPDFTADLDPEDTDPGVHIDMLKAEPVIQRGSRYVVVRSTRR